MFQRHQRSIFFALLSWTVAAVAGLIIQTVQSSAGQPNDEQPPAAVIASLEYDDRAQDEWWLSLDVTLTSKDIPDPVDDLQAVPSFLAPEEAERAPLATPFPPTTLTLPAPLDPPPTLPPLVDGYAFESIDTEVFSAIIDTEAPRAIIEPEVLLLAEAVPAFAEPQPVLVEVPDLDQALESHTEDCSPDRERLSPYSTYESVSAWGHLVCDIFPRTEWQRAFCVIGWESGGDPTESYLEATGDWSVGLFQVNSDNLAGRNRISGLRDWVDVYNDGQNYSVREAMDLLLIPEWNVQAAFDIWFSNGWAKPWSAQRRRCDL